jgi:1,4-dihydroxy-2-naphthoate octaprenyltransferase
MSVWLAALRPRTFPASLVPVAVGLAVASHYGRLDLAIGALTVASALALQIATNLANDYFDAQSGVDHGERLGPARATQSGLLAAEAVRRAAYAALFVGAAAGVPLIVRGGLPIAATGILSMIAALAYSGGPYPLASLGLGEALAFLFFGVVAVGGTVYLQLHDLPLAALLAGASLGCHAAAIMLVNNLRDIPTDEAAGKRTLAVRIGAPEARRWYGLLLLASLVLACGVAIETRSVWPLLALGVAPLARSEAARVAERNGAELNASLAATARLELVFGALLALGLVLA